MKKNKKKIKQTTTTPTLSTVMEGEVGRVMEGEVGKMKKTVEVLMLAVKLSTLKAPMAVVVVEPLTMKALEKKGEMKLKI